MAAKGAVEGPSQRRNANLSAIFHNKLDFNSSMGDSRKYPYHTMGAGAEEITLWRLALFLCLDHPPKRDLTSAKKARWAAKSNLNATWSFSQWVKWQYFVIGGIFLTFYLAMINNILSSSSSYRLFEEQNDYLLKNTLVWRRVFLRNVVVLLRWIPQESSFAWK